MKNIQVKPLWKSKTLWTNILFIGIAITQMIQEHAVSPNTIVLMGLINIGLRFVTKQGIGMKRNI